jgi:hypothetical protein
VADVLRIMPKLFTIIALIVALDTAILLLIIDVANL